MSEDRTLIDAAVENLPQASIQTSVAGIEDLAALIRHPSSKIELEDLERFRAAPRRIQASPSFETPKAFADYVNDFGKSGATRIFASLDDARVVAEIDYHRPETPESIKINSDHASWRTHQAFYPIKFSDAFAEWLLKSGDWMSQRDFAEFLEDRAGDAIEPDAATLMEIAQNFEVARGVSFKSAQNLSNGMRSFRFEETDSAKGELSCPKIIALRTPVYYGTDPVEWAVRLSYDISEGKLKFKVAIHRLQDLKDREFGKLVDALSVDLPRFELHRGKT